MKQYILNEIIKASNQFNEIYVNATLHTRKSQPLFLDLMTTNGTRRAIELNLTLEVMDGTEEIINPELRQLLESNNILPYCTTTDVNIKKEEDSIKLIRTNKSDNDYLTLNHTASAINFKTESDIKSKVNYHITSICTSLISSIIVLKNTGQEVVSIRILSESDSICIIVLELADGRIIDTDLCTHNEYRPSLREMLKIRFENTDIGAKINL